MHRSLSGVRELWKDETDGIPSRVGDAQPHVRLLKSINDDRFRGWCFRSKAIVCKLNDTVLVMHTDGLIRRRDDKPELAQSR